ncbi:MAG TPA: hypothetical protein VGX03_37525 [Candidatus Binatia bacterium]|jgi:hypothetical protein|nr:hypothetical protein [Candidatus Binatia bacterium]
MTDDQIKEKVRYYAEWIRLLWITLIGLSGGISGLVLALDSPVRVILLVVAATLVVGSVVMILLVHRAILRLIGQLQGGKS